MWESVWELTFAKRLVKHFLWDKNLASNLPFILLAFLHSGIVFRVWGLGFRVLGFGLRVQVSGFRV